MARDLYELGLYYGIGPQTGMNVFHFASDAEATEDPDTHAAGVIAAFNTTLQEAWMDCLPTFVTLIGYKARRINNLGGPGIAVPMTDVTGTRTGDMFTSGNTAVIVWNYQKGDGHWRAGRTFLPAVSETDMANNATSSALNLKIQDFIELMLEVPTMAILTPAVEYEARIWSPTHSEHSGISAGHVAGKPGQINRRMKPAF